MKNYTKTEVNISKTNIKQQLLEMLMLDIRFFDNDTCINPTPVKILPKPILNLLEEYPIGGVILFRENLQNLAEIINLTDDLQKNSLSGRLIAVDQEGGTVTRVHNATEMPGNMALGAIDNIKITTKTAEVIAAELKYLGFNFVFAPVLDVNSNPCNPIVGVRSFGSYPELVAKHGVAFLNGFKKSSILSCGKHFPGHGDTSADSHHDLPCINRTMEEFDSMEFIPFKATIKHNIDALMTAHIVAPELDSNLTYSNKQKKYVNTPATLSKVILTDLLRTKLKYNGLIVSDALDMKAISDNFTNIEATVKCIEAGIDIILMPIRLWTPLQIENFKIYFDELVKECTNSKTLTQRILESSTRILNIKKLIVKPILQQQQSLNFRKKEVEKFILNNEHKSFQEKIASESITLAKNSSKILPWNCNNNDKILILTENNVIIDDAVKTLNNLGFSNITANKYTDSNCINIKVDNFDKILLITKDLSSIDAVTINNMIENLNNLKKQYLLISANTPYDILKLKNATTNVLAFGCSGIDQTNYTVRKFSLNISEALKKIMTATKISEFNNHLPIDLEM